MQFSLFVVGEKNFSSSICVLSILPILPVQFLLICLLHILVVRGGVRKCQEG